MTASASVSRDMFLLLTHDEGRSAQQFRKFALLGGALADLRAAGRIGLDEGSNPRIVLRDRTPTGDPVLDGVLAGLGDTATPPRLGAAFRARRLDPTTAIAESLEKEGIVTRKRGLLGTSWPLAQESVKATLLGHLVAVLREEREPLDHDRIELGLLQSQRTAYAVLRRTAPELGRRGLNHRLQRIVRKDPLVTGVARATAMALGVIANA
ncbi:GOLPH3/VPS74 family protein [Brachybacterium sp. AOP25-B2-12]|uniref:GOLPH3/VPS74 family protein n=1 Tax=Brachybacterium sp. AOP25-B2-12 TaxID=3457710 RepID=UPI004034D9D5